LLCVPSGEGGVGLEGESAGVAGRRLGVDVARGGEAPKWTRILDYLRCPRCGEHLVRNRAEVSCVRGHRFPERSGYLDFSESTREEGTTARTLSSFGYEWTTFDEVRDEDESFATIYFKDVDLVGCAGAIGLDAGCGKGRFTRVLGRHLKTVVALDGSAAVEAAVDNLREFDNVSVVRADLRLPLFADESFDFVMSLGVLHHLDDPREGFMHLVGYLAPGGQLLVYLYSRPESRSARAVALAAATIVRRLTVHLPHSILRVLAAPIAALLYVGMVLPGRLGERLHALSRLSGLPMSTYRDKPFRSLVLDTFDRLSAPVEHRYIWSELAPWFADAGLVVDAARDETGWFVLAHRPQ
jgi:SAM-dependent methyltransferase